MMTTETLFTLANTSMLFFWFCLIALPKTKITETLIAYPYVPLGLSFFYLFFMRQGSGLAEADFSTLDGILTLYKNSTPEMAAAGWMHYLAFDFWVGAWMLRESQKKNLPQGLIILPLLSTFLLGPVGVLLYSLFTWGYHKLKKR